MTSPSTTPDSSPLETFTLGVEFDPISWDNVEAHFAHTALRYCQRNKLPIPELRLSNSPALAASVSNAAASTPETPSTVPVFSLPHSMAGRGPSIEFRGNTPPYMQQQSLPSSRAMTPVHTRYSPPPALPVDQRRPSNYARGIYEMTARGNTGTLVGPLIFGHINKDRPSHNANGPVFKLYLEFDLGSDDTWVSGDDEVLGNQDMTCRLRGDDTAWPGDTFGERRYPHDKDIRYPVGYVDGTSLSCEPWGSWITIVSKYAPPYERSSHFWLQLGIARAATGHWSRFPASGILGLGRRPMGSDPHGPQTTFIQGLMLRLNSPEMTITMSDLGAGAMTFGDRPDYTSEEARENELGPWSVLRPFADKYHYSFESDYYYLNGRSIRKTTKFAEWDTGCGPCFLEDTYVHTYYSGCKKGFKLTLLPSHVGTTTTAQLPQMYYAIPSDTKLEDIGTVGLDLGGETLHFDARWLPNSKPKEIDGKDYYIGGIQPKSLLTSSPTGPDLIGRVAIFNVELLFQLPDQREHQWAWRQKSPDLGGPTANAK
ncbi:hypothetical protein R3P38DRAFT_2866526 [Favolaschia claudopus]|uniref:Peptidase A1 domain-containing protein n=1 Tax=Favolaschia claudopus TaxID=2862362 RepID=A0AAW0DDT2_9AGAR